MSFMDGHGGTTNNTSIVHVHMDARAALCISATRHARPSRRRLPPPLLLLLLLLLLRRAMQTQCESSSLAMASTPREFSRITVPWDLQRNTPCKRHTHSYAVSSVPVLWPIVYDIVVSAMADTQTHRASPDKGLQSRHSNVRRKSITSHRCAPTSCAVDKGRFTQRDSGASSCHSGDGRGKRDSFHDDPRQYIAGVPRGIQEA
jgi:hypothetical protein